jgi:hypothetical protein
MKKVIRLTEEDLTRIVKRVIQEQSEHVKNLYKSWANKRSGNPEKALSIMNDVLDNQKKLPKKDFSQYSSYDELVSDLNKLKQAAKSEDTTKIYEDKDLLVIVANTWEASCKYGAGSKWCTTSRDDSSYWKRHNQTGTEFFWIFKNKPQNDPNHKFSYHIKVGGDHDWCNAINNCRKELPNDSYPKQHSMYDQIISKLKEFHDQRDMVKNYDQNELKSLTISNWISNNITDLLSDFEIDSHYDQTLSMSIFDFTEEYIYEEIVPFNGDIDDEDYIKEFHVELTNYLEDFNPPFNLGDFVQNSNIINDFTYTINNLLQDIPELYESIANNTANPKNVIDMLIDNAYEDGIKEIIFENLHIYCSDLVRDEASNFASKY